MPQDTIYGSDLSKSQEYLNQREMPELLAVDNSRFLPTTNKRGSNHPIYGEQPAEEPPVEQPPVEQPPTEQPAPPAQGGGQPDDGRDGNRGPTGPGGQGPGLGEGPKGDQRGRGQGQASNARYTVHADRQARGRNYVAKFVQQELPDGNDAAFLMANGRMVDAAAKVVQRIPGRTAASKALAARKLRKQLGPNMKDYVSVNKQEDSHEERLLDLKRDNKVLSSFKKKMGGLLER